MRLPAVAAAVADGTIGAVPPDGCAGVVDGVPPGVTVAVPGPSWRRGVVLELLELLGVAGADGTIGADAGGVDGFAGAIGTVRGTES